MNDVVAVPATGGTVSSEDVVVDVPGGAFGAETVQVSTGAPLGEVEGSFAAEVFGSPVGIEHQGEARLPVTVTWTVAGLSDLQRQTVMLVHWDQDARVWEPASVEPVWSGDTLSAELSEFSFWTWVADVGQATGQWTGSRADPPTCSGKPLPSWIKGTVSPSEATSAAAIQVCFEPDKDDRATVRVTNNRTFSQVMQAGGVDRWAWTWTGPEDYGAAGAVYSVGHTVLDGDATFLLPPVHEQAVGVQRPASTDAAMITGTATVNTGTVVVDVTAFLMDQASIGGTSNPVLNAFLQAWYECAGGKDLLANATTLDVKQIAPWVVGTLTGCGTELLDPDSEFGARFEKLSRQAIASSKMSAAAATMANRAARRLASYAKILTVGQLAFYTSDQLANALVGPLTWSIRGTGRPPALGAWTPTCTDTAADSNALYRNVALQDQFSDTGKELWQFPGWEAAAREGVKPLLTCPPEYRAKLADFLPTSWQDTIAAGVVADQLRRSASAGGDPRVLTVTPFLPDGRVGLPLEPQNASSVDASSCLQSFVTEVAGIYICGSVADHLPACWPDSAVLYCMRGPDDTSVVRVWGNNLEAATEPESPEPWHIVLADGSRCDVRLGGAWDMPPDGYYYTYGCDGHYVALLSGETTPTVDDTAATWTATAQSEWGGQLETVEVAQVVYAGPRPDGPAAESGAGCPSAADLQAALETGETLLPETSGGISCVGDWATSAYRFQDNAYPGVFQELDGRWTTVSTDAACTLPRPIPVALDKICEVS